MTSAAELYALQEIDLAIDSITARLAEIEERLGESEELIAAREEAEERRQAVQSLRSRQSELELDVEEVRAKAGEIEKKLYGGTIRNPKELQDLQADLTALQGQVRRREDALLDLLVQLEEAESELSRAETALRESEDAWRKEQEELQRERQELEGELAQLQERRARRSNGMDSGALNLYQLLRERRQGRAVAPVERGMCQGCRITLPMSVLQKARAGAGLVQCVSCERILFVI